MLLPMIATEVTKLLVGKLSELKAEDAAKVLAAVRGTAAAPALLVPGLGALGLGIVVGASIGVLVAPRSGAETRAALKDSVRNKLGTLRSKFSGGAAVEEVAARAPAEPSISPREPKTAN